MSPTNNMIMMKLGGYSVLDLCRYRQQGTYIFRQPMTVVDTIWTAPGERGKDTVELQLPTPATWMPNNLLVKQLRLIQCHLVPPDDKAHRLITIKVNICSSTCCRLCFLAFYFHLLKSVIIIQQWHINDCGGKSTIVINVILYLSVKVKLFKAVRFWVQTVSKLLACGRKSGYWGVPECTSCFTSLHVVLQAWKKVSLNPRGMPQLWSSCICMFHYTALILVNINMKSSRNIVCPYPACWAPPPTMTGCTCWGTGCRSWRSTRGPGRWASASSTPQTQPQ